MSPTISHDNETTLESDEMCENNNNKIELNNNVIIKMENERKEPKDRSMEQKCAKRKLSCDGSSKSKKRRQNTSDEDTIISSLSSSFSLNSDDYGTDTELIAIDQNKRKHKYSHRYAPLSPYDNHNDDDSLSCVISSSDSGCNVRNILCKRDYAIAINDSNVTSSTTHIDDMVKKISSSMKISNGNTRQLFDIAMTTFRLVKKNQEFQQKLRELQMDTKNFIDSVMENPENQSIKEQLKLLM